MERWPDGLPKINSPCPNCGRPNDAVSNSGKEDAEPTPGQFALCFGCAALLVFQADMTLGVPTIAQLEQARTDPSFWNFILGEQQRLKDFLIAKDVKAGVEAALGGKYPKDPSLN